MTDSNHRRNSQPSAADSFPFVDLIDSYWEWDVKGDRTIFSPLLHKLTGFSAEEAETDPEFWSQVVHRDDMKVLKDLRRWALKRSAPVFETKLRLKSKDGEWLWYLIRATIAQRDEAGVPSRVSGVMFNISEQEGFKTALHQTSYILRQLHSISTSHEMPLQERLERILAAGCEHFGLPNGIISHIYEGQYEVLAVHTEGDSINTGDVYPLGMTFCSETLEFGGAVYFEDAELSRFKTHPCYLEFGLSTYIGIPIEVNKEIYGTLNFTAPLARLKPFNETDNEILKLMGQWVGAALTRREMGRQLLETERQFQHAQKLETVGRLVSGVAHDINNLLTAIIGYTELARLEIPDGHRSGDDLGQAVSAAKRGARITRRLLGFSRPAAHSPTALNIDGSIKDTCKLIAQMAGDGVSVVPRLEAPEALVVIDPAQLDQVLMNLAVNARDAMDGGGTITITTAVEDSMVKVSFADDGCGMDEKTANRVFEPFFTTKSPEVGTGLGLATVHSIILKAGGTVNIKTAPGQGTTFNLGLPQALEKPAAPKIPVRPTAVPSAVTALLIEGEELVRHTVTGYLENAGHKVLSAENGQLAEELWNDQGADIDLIICDVTPPGSPGWEFALSAHHNGKHPMLLFMSAYPTSYLEEIGHPALHYPMLEKPFDFEALILKLGQILG